tara:strand:- start:3779 stop:6322 length:2544 start_codon:yes stop_codon:yes gene_type:complete
MRLLENHLFGLLSRFVIARPLVVISVGLTLAIVGLLTGASTISLNADTDDLISDDVPYMAAYRAFAEEFGDLERMWIVIDGGSGSTSVDCAQWIRSRLEADRSLGEIHGGISPMEQLRLASRTMSAGDLESIIGGCQSLAIAVSSGDVLESLSGMLEASSAADGDPSDMRRRLTGAITAVKWLVEGPPMVSDQLLKSEGGRYIFIGIMPPKNYGTLGVIERPVRIVRELLEQARLEFPSIEMGLTGKPVLQADEMATSDRDMTRAALLAIVLVAIVIMLVLGAIWQPLLAMLAFGCAAGWTYGLVGLTIGQLNLLSIVFMLVLIGVGLDFGVHVISRYVEFRDSRGRAGSVRGLYGTVMRGNASAVLTSSATFFVAWFTDFQGLRELGLIAGVGLLLCFLSMATVLPALLMLTDRSPRSTRDRFKGIEFGLMDRLVRRPFMVVACSLIVSMLLVPFAMKMGFERNLLELQATGIESAQWERRIASDSDSATWSAAAVVETREEVAAMVDRARSQDMIGRVRSIQDVIGESTPEQLRLRGDLASCEVRDVAIEAKTMNSSLADMQSALDRLAAMAGDQRMELMKIIEELEALRDMGTGAATVISGNIRELDIFLQSVRSGEDLELRASLPDGMRNEMMSSSGRFLVLMHPRENVWDYEAMGRFVSDVRAIAPDATGIPMTHYESLDAMRDAFVLMMSLAIAFITIITILTFRNALDVIVCLLTLVIGLWWTVGFMSVLGVSFNLANFFAAPILVGLGIDGSLHMVHRWREGGENRLQFGGTRRAVVLTSVTTMIGFGCLVIAEHKGLRSLGIVMAIGSAACLMAVVVLLPSLLAIRERCFGDGRVQGH